MKKESSFKKKKKQRKQLFPKPSLVDDPAEVDEVKELTNFNNVWHPMRGIGGTPRNGEGLGGWYPRLPFLLHSKQLCKYLFHM